MQRARHGRTDHARLSGETAIAARNRLGLSALLRQQHLAPRRWRPRIKSPDVFRFASGPQRRPDPVRALRAMPPLLRSYLAMGGWVSDHAVVDRDLATLHVFTGLEVGSVPPARRRLLRAVAADQPPLATDHALA